MEKTIGKAIYNGLTIGKSPFSMENPSEMVENQRKTYRKMEVDTLVNCYIAMERSTIL